MASTILRKLYREERDKHRTMRVGFSAVDAYRDAIIRRKWRALEDSGYVRFETPYDNDPDISFLDQDCFNSDRGGIALTKRIRELASDEGVFGLVGEYRLDTDSDSWESGGSVWGFIGYDDTNPRNNCYATSVMLETIEAFRAAWKDHIRNVCPQCHGTGRAR